MAKEKVTQNAGLWITAIVAIVAVFGIVSIQSNAAPKVIYAEQPAVSASESSNILGQAIRFGEDYDLEPNECTYETASPCKGYEGREVKKGTIRWDGSCGRSENDELLMSQCHYNRPTME